MVFLGRKPPRMPDLFEVASLWFPGSRSYTVENFGHKERWHPDDAHVRCRHRRFLMQVSSAQMQQWQPPSRPQPSSVISGCVLGSPGSRRYLGRISIPKSFTNRAAESAVALPGKLSYRSKEAPFGAASFPSSLS